ncbi:MAG: hypothetical protein HYV37_03510 [Candidatus Levyibacteriota bacterium]|nr:MAG: hypothetical protein HYV37_03510 [Candidatus Levybacteria bacterium]
MKKNPISMEKYFTPGLKTKPGVHIGSQTHPLFHGIAKEQAYEGYYLGAAGEGDVAIVRNFEQTYIDYWKNLIGDHHIINLTHTDPGAYLTQSILDDPKVIEDIKHHMDPKSRLHVFSPTRLEQKLADKLGIPLHGKPEIGERFGTKSGTRRLAKKYGIPMAPGFVCKSVRDVEKAFNELKKYFRGIVIKYDYSLGGYFSKRVETSNKIKIKELLDEIIGRKFREGKDTVVVEGWLKSKATPCAHIEILEGQDPVICTGWQQIVDVDGISRIGAGPLTLSDRAMKSFLSAVNKLAWALKDKGACGSFGPDFLITADDETQMPPDTAVLLELNGRIPMTAIAFEIIQNVRGKIGSGFWAQHLTLKSPLTFEELAEKLSKEGILIQKKDKRARGIVPFNTGLLPWKMLDLVVMADTWDETVVVMRKAQQVLRALDA